MILNNLPESNENVSGTLANIKKAEKYRAEQISKNDVILDKNAMTDLLQSDDVTKMLNDADFQKAVLSTIFKDYQIMQIFKKSWPI